MFRKPKFKKTPLNGVELWEDLCLTDKLEKLQTEGGQIETGSPLQYTNRTDGVRPEHNIRTNKWDIAENTIQAAMDFKRRAQTQKEAEEIAKNQERVESNGEGLKKAENGQAENPTAGE